MLARKRIGHELRPFRMLTHKSSLKVSIVLTDCSCKKRANLYCVSASLNKSLADVMLMTPLGRVATWRTRDPCCVSVLRVRKSGRRICKRVYNLNTFRPSPASRATSCSSAGCTRSLEMERERPVDCWLLTRGLLTINAKTFRRCRS